MKGYLAANPGHQFAVEEEAGIIAVIATSDANQPDDVTVLAWSSNLVALLDQVGAPAAEDLS
jgi:hypothetical protein